MLNRMEQTVRQRLRGPRRMVQLQLILPHRKEAPTNLAAPSAQLSVVSAHHKHSSPWSQLCI
jgi:hypothetical protein